MNSKTAIGFYLSVVGIPCGVMAALNIHFIWWAMVLVQIPNFLIGVLSLIESEPTNE